MAAMAPALTDAPPEAHRIRFKLAPPSSTLSPNPVQPQGSPGHILVTPSNGAVVKRSRTTASPSSEDHHQLSAVVNSNGNSSKTTSSCKLEQSVVRGEATPPGRGRRPQLVASYLCSDVPSGKESLKQVLFQTHNLLPGYLPRKHTPLGLELTEEIQSLMSCGTGTGGGGSPPVPVAASPINGVAKTLAKTGSDQDCALAAVNGGSKTPLSTDSPPLPRSAVSRGGSARNGPLRGESVSQPPTGNPEQAPTHSNLAPSEDPTDNGSNASTTPPTTFTAVESFPPSSPSPAPQQPTGSLGAELRDRTQQSQSRQGEIEGRLRRLRKRLQVVQAKQVERHVRQQLGGLLQTTLGTLEALRHRDGGPLTLQERDGLGRFLKGGSVPAELERLSLSGATNLRAAEGAFDSDATESSSGGETDVEEDELSRVDVEQRHIPLWRRAEGRYALDRASIISHWNWLQAHVSDLEYRIRQQTDIYRQIRSSKGSIVLGDPESPLEDGVEVKSEPVACQITQYCSLDLLPEGSISTETSLRKGCPSGRQVNGVINSLRPGSPEALDPDDLRQQQWASSHSVSPPDHTCVAARTRPLLSYKKRRLVRPNSVANINRKSQRASVCRCSCEVNPQCVTCVSRSTPPLDVQYDRPLLDRLTQFDPCIHPILSFSDDVTMNLHLQRTLKSHWQGRPLDKIKPVKKLSLKHKLSQGTRLSEPCSSSSSSSSKDKYKLTNSLLSSVRLSYHKVRGEKLHYRQPVDILLRASKLESRHHRSDRAPGSSHSAFEKGHSRKRPREPSLDRMDNTPKLYMDMGNSCPSLTTLQTPTHSPLLRQLSTSSETSTPVSINSQSIGSNPTPIRRRRGESSFDINNIVIPMSVAATTRVEKLQYKEILTPSWRVVDVLAKPLSPEDDVVEVEDLSDGTFSQLHLPCEEQERSRWTWTASAVAKRRGSRSYKSVDGRTTPLLGGTNPSTPQPSSPDNSHFHLLQDYSSAPSPCSPASPELLPNLYSRETHRLLSNEDTRCSTPDNTCEEMPVQPWECRDFPLEFDPLQEADEQQCSPTGDRSYRTIRRISGCKTGSSKSESDAGPPSPLPDDSSTRQKHPSSTLRATHR
ncbi:KAT8 regulatory NSL complex subunit 1 isoform X2 [Denticeps clupeoides]|uniref:KAT8 regulatory NSL complex subunit 1 isoform X2 n=1 Tax=Denticeps clupeoides TaxID=299321 RepID=UPI0010A3B50C|nr:KAT8 regulatory NSL complex subunit 1 isoform X2 [Denticeps clupeoides]